MGVTKITIEFNADKYKALQKFAGKREMAVENELVATLDKLYLKVVPAPVREFIEESDAPAK